MNQSILVSSNGNDTGPQQSATPLNKQVSFPHNQTNKSGLGKVTGFCLEGWSNRKSLLWFYMYFPTLLIIWWFFAAKKPSKLSDSITAIHIEFTLVPCIYTQFPEWFNKCFYLWMQFLDSKYAMPEAASTANFTNCLVFMSSFFFLKNDRKSPPRETDRRTVRIHKTEL